MRKYPIPRWALLTLVGLSTGALMLSMTLAQGDGAPPASLPDTDIAVKVGDPPTSSQVGSTVSFGLDVVNNGPADAAGVTLSYQVPSQFTLVSSSATSGHCVLKGKNVDCAIGAIATGAQETAELALKVAAAGLVTNKADVSGDNSDPIRSNNSVAFQINVPADSTPTCQGKPATVVGTTMTDVLTGTSRRDVIASRGGADTIYGLGGDDIVCSGAGMDMVVLGPGNDIGNGGNGNDVLLGGGDKDLLLGKAGRDVLKGMGDADRLKGGMERDKCVGGSGADAFRTCESRRQ